MYKDVEKYSVFRNKSNSYIKVLKKGVQIKNKDFKPHRYHVLPVPLLFKKKGYLGVRLIIIKTNTFCLNPYHYCVCVIIGVSIKRTPCTLFS